MGWVLLVGLMLVQPGSWPGSLAVRADDQKDACGCPCEGVAESQAEDQRDGQDPRACPGEGSGEHCPPGCEDCACCPAALVALCPGTQVLSVLDPRGEFTSALLDSPAMAEFGRVFRPPRLSFS